MERLLILLGLCALVHTQYLNNSSEEENDSEVIILKYIQIIELSAKTLNFN